MNLGSLLEKQMLLIRKPSLQPRGGGGGSFYTCCRSWLVFIAYWVQLKVSWDEGALSKGWFRYDWPVSVPGTILLIID